MRMLKIIFFQITANSHTNESAFIVAWCRYFNNTRRMSKLVSDIKINPSEGFYSYTIEFAVKNEDSMSVSTHLQKTLLQKLCLSSYFLMLDIL